MTLWAVAPLVTAGLAIGLEGLKILWSLLLLTGIWWFYDWMRSSKEIPDASEGKDRTHAILGLGMGGFSMIVLGLTLAGTLGGRIAEISLFGSGGLGLAAGLLVSYAGLVVACTQLPYIVGAEEPLSTSQSIFCWGFGIRLVRGMPPYYDALPEELQP
jgi:hypothetical protein